MRLTPRQKALLSILKEGPVQVDGLREHLTASRLDARGLITMDPSSFCELTDAGRKALEDQA